MRVVLQVVRNARVDIGGETVGAIGRGFLLLIGICESDTEETVDRMIDKIGRLRIFPDENGKTNLSLQAVGGEILAVSQFTLFADCRHGNRPSFLGSGSPEHAEKLYHRAVERCRSYAAKVAEGRFGADMQVSLLNDGPFTLMLDSDTLFLMQST